MKFSKLAAALAVVAAILPAQPRHLSFEVASVRRNTAGESPDFVPRRSGDRVTMHDIRLPSVVIYAYHLDHGLATTSFQLAGNLQLPEGWEVYDIDALAPGSPSDDDLRAMFQTLLEERFKLKAHWETREIQGYELRLGKSGAKLEPTVPGRKPDYLDTPRERGVSRLIGKADSIEQLVRNLSARLESPVRNLSGLTGGSYDFDVPYATDGNLTVATSAPDLITAVDRELGLKLKPSRVPVQVLVVDHVEKPSEN